MTQLLVSVYGRLFLFARLNLPNVVIRVAKKKIDNDFPCPCFDVPKAWNFTSGGVQNRKTKNRRLGMNVMSFQYFKLCKKQISLTFSYFLINKALLYHFLVNWLTYNKKSVFLKVWSPEMMLQSFPASCFWSRSFVPHRKWNFMFWYIKTRVRNITIEIFYGYSNQYIREI